MNPNYFQTKHENKKLTLVSQKLINYHHIYHIKKLIIHFTKPNLKNNFTKTHRT